jgi:hypothetical protein
VSEFDELRALVREVIRDVLPDGLPVNGLPVTETVYLSTDEDLAAFVARLLDLDPGEREDLQTGRKRFRLARGNDGTAATAGRNGTSAALDPAALLNRPALDPAVLPNRPAPAQAAAADAAALPNRPAPTQAAALLIRPAPAQAAAAGGAPVRRVESGAVTEALVKQAARAGERLVLGRGAVLTPLARDRARASGVEIVKER